ncbi:MAG TPA: YqeG family HAD IIIA-type phosphatase [Fimbriimonadales bacterium]|nr:YqeG family HAD IIIA-type phosphatase [Fimbriimonadales bacterium]
MFEKVVKYHREKAPKWLRRFCPDYHALRIHHIEPDSLKKEGIKAVLLDVDNTLLPWKGMQTPKETLEWVKKCREIGLKLCLVSNTRNPRRLKILSEEWGIPFVRGRNKPAKSGFQKALELLDVKPEETVMIGDQIFTDIWGGNRAGIRTILVRPMHPREFIGTKVSRIAEKWLVKFLPKAEGESP